MKRILCITSLAFEFFLSWIPITLVEHLPKADRPLDEAGSSVRPFAGMTSAKLVSIGTAFFVLVFLVFGFPLSVSAHVLGGPPFLQVNDQYAQTNPYYQGQVTLNIAQDLASGVFLSGKSINFNLDLGALQRQTTLPTDIAKQLTFRWSFAQGNNFEKVSPYQNGDSVDYTFASPQSYVVTVEGKLPTDTDWTLLDTAQVDVRPTASYKLPQVAIFVGTNNLDSNTPVLLVSQTSFDTSVKREQFLWDFGEGKTYEGVSYEKSFADLNAFSLGLIYHRVIDDHGFIRDVGFTVDHVKGKLKFAPFGNMKTAPVQYGSIEQAKAMELGINNGNQKRFGAGNIPAPAVTGRLLYGIAAALLSLCLAMTLCFAVWRKSK